MARTQVYTAQQIADALTRAKGFVSVAAKNLGCADATVRNYIDRYAICKQAVVDAREQMIDIAEGRLYQNINEGDNTAIIFFLKTQAKHRGYIEKSVTEVTGTNGGPVEVATLTNEERIARLAELFDAARTRRDRRSPE